MTNDEMITGFDELLFKFYETRPKCKRSNANSLRIFCSIANKTLLISILLSVPGKISHFSQWTNSEAFNIHLSFPFLILIIVSIHCKYNLLQVAVWYSVGLWATGRSTVF